MIMWAFPVLVLPIMRHILTIAPLPLRTQNIQFCVLKRIASIRVNLAHMVIISGRTIEHQLLDLNAQL